MFKELWNIVRIRCLSVARDALVLPLFAEGARCKETRGVGGADVAEIQVAGAEQACVMVPHLFLEEKML